MKKMNLAIPIYLALAVGLVASVVLAQKEAANNHFIAKLSGPQAGSKSPGSGEAIFQLARNGQALNFRLTVQGVKDITMAHIHLGKPGKEGPPVVWLYPATPPPKLRKGVFHGVLAHGSVTAKNFVGPLQGKSMEDLVKEIKADDAYVNVHSEEYPAGAIRGQIK
jgi:hypothetical protein